MKFRGICSIRGIRTFSAVTAVLEWRGWWLGCQGLIAAKDLQWRSPCSPSPALHLKTSETMWKLQTRERERNPCILSRYTYIYIYVCVYILSIYLSTNIYIYNILSIYLSIYTYNCPIYTHRSIIHMIIYISTPKYKNVHLDNIEQKLQYMCMLLTSSNLK